ncbi:hypothetical protein EDB19DRAFT_1715976 [Suillus lakei]|nr:hypothetical protein EDB19DRAFT_1715976 [Suillus lakei]
MVKWILQVLLLITGLSNSPRRLAGSNSSCAPGDRSRRDFESSLTAACPSACSKSLLIRFSELTQNDKKYWLDRSLATRCLMHIVCVAYRRRQKEYL